MNEFIQKLIELKNYLNLTICLAAVTTFFSSLFMTITEKSIFGVSLALWLIAAIVNLFDIITGLKAFAHKQRENGDVFKISSKKGWRGIEKASMFTAIIFIIYLFEKESLRLGFTENISLVAVYIKFFVFFYGILMELVSIGENREVVLGYKPKIFKSLDKVAEFVTDGIIERAKKFIKNE